MTQRSYARLDASLPSREGLHFRSLVGVIEALKESCGVYERDPVAMGRKT